MHRCTNVKCTNAKYNTTKCSDAKCTNKCQMPNAQLSNTKCVKKEKANQHTRSSASTLGCSIFRTTAASATGPFTFIQTTAETTTNNKATKTKIFNIFLFKFNKNKAKKRNFSIFFLFKFNNGNLYVDA